tara:strand:- start:65892 stop:66449 length:558 start_codon:yes stop_codon:yes gene_type:complete
MSTNKLTPRSLGCFQQVADVIGEEAAEVELQKVIDYEGAVWINLEEDLVDSFVWDATPQGGRFWDNIDDGYIPEGYVTGSQEQPDVMPEPKFGDVLHINGNARVYLSTYGHNSHKLASEDSQIHIVSLDEIDEYATNPYQEQRERILKRWKGKSLDNAHDTERGIAQMRVSDLIDFVQENLLAES